MGCDIHAFVEYKETWDNGHEQWTAFSGELDLGRNYFIFGCLTNGNVRYPIKIKPGVEPKGLPSIVSWEVEHANTLYITEKGDGERETTIANALKWAKDYGKKFTYDVKSNQPIKIENPDWHTHSWLTVKEYEAILKTAEKIAKKEGESIYFPYWSVLDLMKSLTKRGEEARLVFWFDN